jgi:hypothetical protein
MYEMQGPGDPLLQLSKKKQKKAKKLMKNMDKQKDRRQQVIDRLSAKYHGTVKPQEE